MYRISQDIISQRRIPDGTTDAFPIPFYKYKVVLSKNDGGENKTWHLGAQNCPIESITYNWSEKGCMDASIKMHQMDFPVYYGDEVLIYYEGKKDYRGYVANIPDSKGDTLKIVPYTKRLNEIRFNSTFSNYTFLEMLSTTIADKVVNTGVLYNASMINYSDTSVYESVSYKYEPVKKLIDDYFENEDDAYWGVEQNGFLYMKKRESTTKHILYAGSNQAFESLKYKKDYSKIKATRYHLYQKSTGESGTTYIASIPDGTTTYPLIGNEMVVGIKEMKLTAPDGLNSTEIKDWGYAKLKEQRIPQNIKIKNLDRTRYDLKIGEKIKIYDELGLQLKKIIDCESTDKWVGEASLSDDSVEGTYSISFDSNYAVFYDFGEIQRYFKIYKIIFMIKSDKIGNFLNFSHGQYFTGYSGSLYSIGDYSINSQSTLELFSSNTETNFSINRVNVWNKIEIPLTCDLRYIGFRDRGTTGESATILIDDIRLYGYFSNSYEANVIKLRYNVDKNNESLYNVELGDYDPLANDLLFNINKKIAAIEAAQQV